MISPPGRRQTSDCTLGLVKAGGTQWTDATHVLAAIRVMNRLELIGETVRAVLNDLATINPDWLSRVAPTEWYQRCSRRIEDERLPKSQEKRAAYAQTIGEDGFKLLDLLNRSDAPAQTDQLQSIQALHLVLARLYERRKATIRSNGESYPTIMALTTRSSLIVRPV